MELFLIRHAEPVRAEVAEGPADPPLHERGRAQARLLAAWLAAERLDAVASSPLRRAVETAEVVAAAAGLALEIVDDLAEYDRHMGAYVPIEELRATADPRWKAMATGAYFGDDEDEATFTTRVTNGMEQVIARHPGRRVAVVCHGGVLNVYLSRVLGRGGSPMFFLPAYASLSRVAAQRGGLRSVLSLNETAHLRGQRPAGPVRYGPGMAVDETLLAELKDTKASIDELQQRLKDLVAQLQAAGATTQEITAALRS